MVAHYMWWIKTSDLLKTKSLCTFSHIAYNQLQFNVTTEPSQIINIFIQSSSSIHKTLKKERTQRNFAYRHGTNPLFIYSYFILFMASFSCSHSISATTTNNSSQNKVTRGQHNCVRSFYNRIYLELNSFFPLEKFPNTSKCFLYRNSSHSIRGPPLTG